MDDGCDTCPSNCSGRADQEPIRGGLVLRPTSRSGCGVEVSQSGDDLLAEQTNGAHQVLVAYRTDIELGHYGVKQPFVRSGPDAIGNCLRRADEDKVA